MQKPFSKGIWHPNHYTLQFLLNPSDFLKNNPILAGICYDSWLRNAPNCAFRENMIQEWGRFLRSKTLNSAPNCAMSGSHAVNNNWLFIALWVCYTVFPFPALWLWRFLLLTRFGFNNQWLLQIGFCLNGLYHKEMDNFSFKQFQHWLNGNRNNRLPGMSEILL